MKKLFSIFAALFFVVLSFSAKAQTQTPTDYFVGKWNLEVKGTPQGDSKMTVVWERKDGKLIGYLPSAPNTTDTVKFTKVEEKEKSVTVYFSSGGYDVNITMVKKDDVNVTGDLMGMFDATGTRVKEATSK